MEPRTEALAEAGVLPLSMGGTPVRLRTLTIEESEEWQRALSSSISRIDVVEDANDGAAMLASLLLAGASARLEVVLAYDLDGRLGGRDAIRKAMTQRELGEALEAMLEAELDPKGVVDRASVAEAFGEPMRLAVGTLVALRRSLSGSYPNGRSSTGESDTTTSGGTGPTSSSSSDGPTPSDESTESLVSAAT